MTRRRPQPRNGRPNYCVSVRAEAHEALRAHAERVGVSVASLVDGKLRELATAPAPGGAS